MKKIVFTTLALVYSSMTMGQGLPIRGCDEKPQEVAWVVTIEKDGTYYGNGYCYAGAAHNHIGFSCDIGGTVARSGDKVLGYTDYRCTDIGHLPGYHYAWTPVPVPEKVISM